jgi:hypothetical protein
MFSWVGIHINLDNKNITTLAEANRMRNILLHRYGEISEKDALDFPTLSEWKGSVMPFNKEVFNRYFNSIKSTFMALLGGIQMKVNNDKSMEPNSTDS